MSSEDCDDNDSCTIDSCTYRSCVHTPVLDCDTCGTNVTVAIETNEYSKEFSWVVKDVDTNRVVMRNAGSLSENQVYTESKCLQFGAYNFISSYDNNETALSNATHTLRVGETILFKDSTNTYIEIENEFTICSTDKDCFDYDGCTSDFCNPATKTCENELMNICSNCEWISIEVKPDNYPDETTWFLRNHENNDLVLSGDPYLKYDIASGRLV